MDHMLTPRESEVLARLVAGESTALIAAGLFVSLHTVRNHIAAIMTKTDTHSRLEAVAHAADPVDRGAVVLAWCAEQGWALTELTQLLIVSAFLAAEAEVCDGVTHRWPAKVDDGPWVCVCGAMSVG